MGRYTNPRVRIYNDALTLQGTITTVLHMEYECVLNEIGVGAFVIPLVDTPGRALAIENNLAVFTVEIDSTETAFGWIVITDIDDKTREAAGELVVTGYGIMHKLTYDRMNYTVISDGSGGKTSTARLDVLALSQYAWTVNSTTYNPSPRTAGAKLVPANETLFEALLQAGAQDQYNWLDRPEYPPAHRANSVKDMDHLDDDPDPIVSSYSVHFRPDADDTNTDHIPLADGGIKIKTNRSQVPTRAYIYGGGGGQDRFTIEEADGYITPPSGFSFDFATSEVINDTLEAISNQPVISDNKNFPDIKPEDPTDITTVRASAVALCEAGLTYLLARQQSNDTFYDIAPTFVGKVVWPGRDFCRLTYSKTSPYNAAGSEVTTTIIDIDIATHILGVKYTFGGDNVLMGSFSLGPAPRLVRTGMNETVERIQNVEKRLDHLTASASISNPSPTQTYANSDGTYLVVSTNSVLTNERQFAAGNGLTASDGGANSTYTVNVGAGDGIDVAANFIAVDVTDLIGTGLTEEATNNIAVDFTVVAAQADLHDRQHSITSASDHTVTGSALDVVGLTAANTLGILTPSAAVSSATSVLLKTDSNGRFQVQGLGIGVSASNNDSIRFNDGVNNLLFSAVDPTYPDEGLSVRSTTSQTAGDSIFRVLSSGGSERLRVEHDAYTSTTNTWLGPAYETTNAEVRLDTGGIDISTSGDRGVRVLMTNSDLSGYVTFLDYDKTDRNGGSAGSLNLGTYINASNSITMRMSKQIFDIVVHYSGSYYFPFEVRGDQVLFAECPTSDPGIPGAIWRSSGDLRISV